jgi:glycosidase
MGDFQEIQTINRQSTVGFDAGIYAFTRWSDTQKLIVVTNFSGRIVFSNLRFLEVITKWELKDGELCD